MTDLKRLKCKICDFESDNLVTHIEAEHSNHPECPNPEEVLVWYLMNFGLSEVDVVHPEYGKKTTAKKPKLEVASDSIEVAGVAMTKGIHPALAPKLNPAYLFSKLAKDVLSDIKENRRVMLVGHTGTGKTSLVEQIASRIGQGVLRSNMNNQTTVGDFVGFMSLQGGETKWIDGVLPKAMREGLWLIIDEIDFAEPAILAVLNAVLEPNGKLMLKEKGHEIVTPHPNFRIFATANTVGCMASYRGLYQGTNLMNEASLDRWRVYKVEYLTPEEEVQILTATIPSITTKIAGIVVQVSNEIRVAFANEEISTTMSLRRMIDWVELMIRHREPLKAAEVAIFSKTSQEDTLVIKGIIERIMVPTRSA